MFEPDAPIQVTFDVDREVVSRHTSSDLHLVVGVRCRGTHALVDRCPTSVVLVIDVSASMSGEPLRHVVRSAERIAAQLRTVDRLGVVAFSDSAVAVMDPQPVDGAMRRELGQRLRQLLPQSRTNVEAGLQMAYQTLRRCSDSGHSLAVLLSDGQPNVGACGSAELAQLALRSKATTATLGYGPQHDDQVLGAIADGGRGRYAFIADPQLCQLELARAIGAHGEAVIVDVQARIAARDGAALRWVAGPSVQRRGPESVLRSPDLADGGAAVFAAALTTRPSSAAKNVELADVTVSYRLPSEPRPRSASRRIGIPTGDVSTPVLARPLRAALLAEFGLRRREAWELADAGRWAEAETRLRDMADRIDRAPDSESDRPLRDAFEQLVDDLELVRRRPDSAVHAAYRRGQRTMGAVRVASAQGRALLADAAGDVPRAQLVCLEGSHLGTAYTLAAENALGRSTFSDICIADASVSRRHTAVVAADGAFWVTDLGSTNPTVVNGRAIDRHRLVHGDVIELGSHRFRYVQHPE